MTFTFQSSPFPLLFHQVVPTLCRIYGSQRDIRPFRLLSIPDSQSRQCSGLLFYTVWGIFVEEIFFCLAYPFLLLDLDVLAGILPGNLVDYVVVQDIIREL